jgi:hypothetical protein
MKLRCQDPHWVEDLVWREDSDGRADVRLKEKIKGYNSSAQPVMLM